MLPVMQIVPSLFTVSVRSKFSQHFCLRYLNRCVKASVGIACYQRCCPCLIYSVGEGHYTVCVNCTYCVIFRIEAQSSEKPAHHLSIVNRNDLVITESHRVKILEDAEGRSILRFDPASNVDVGIYKAVARNKVGQTQARTRLQLSHSSQFVTVSRKFCVLNHEDFLSDFYVVSCQLVMNSYTAYHNNQDKRAPKCRLILSSIRILSQPSLKNCVSGQPRHNFGITSLMNSSYNEISAEWIILMYYH